MKINFNIDKINKDFLVREIIIIINITLLFIII